MIKLSMVISITEAIEIDGLQQAMQEGAGAWTTWKVMQIDVTHRHRQAARQ